LVSEFFDRKLSTCVEKTKFLVLVLNLAVFAGNLILVSGIETSINPPAILKESNPIQKLSDWYNYELWKKDSVGITFNFGVEPELWLDPADSIWV
jgi:hypothetical protein